MCAIALLVLLAASLGGCVSIAPAPAPVTVLSAPAAASAEAEILALLTAQDAAWNAGDIDRFMAGYWKSPDLRFASGGTVTWGWDDTNARYKARYSSRALMGTLTTRDHEIALLSPDAAIAHGRWSLTRAGDTPGGLYTLVLRRIDGQWRIVSDTTTSQ